MKDEGWWGGVGWGGVRMGGYHPDNLALLATYKSNKHLNTYHVSELCGVFFIMLSFLGIENRPFFLPFHKCHLSIPKIWKLLLLLLLLLLLYFGCSKGGGSKCDVSRDGRRVQLFRN
jgi:hypothetical protein